VACDIEEWLRKSVRKDEIGIDAGRKEGDALGEGFDERDAQRPDITGRSEARRSHFGRSVRAGTCGWRVGLRDRRETVTGKFQLIGGGENVGRFYVPMNEAFAVEVDEDIEDRAKHVAGFSGGESALGENLREVLFSELHHGVEKIRVTEAATAEVVKAQ
jgi:hypothetical protein